MNRKRKQSVKKKKKKRARGREGGRQGMKEEGRERGRRGGGEGEGGRTLSRGLCLFAFVRGWLHAFAVVSRPSASVRTCACLSAPVRACLRSCHTRPHPWGCARVCSYCRGVLVVVRVCSCVFAPSRVV